MLKKAYSTIYQNWKTLPRRNQLPLNSLRPSDAYICISKRRHHWSRYWLVAWSAPSHYLNQCWYIVNSNLGNTLQHVQWNFNRNYNIFIQEDAFESVVCEMAAILPQPQCINPAYLIPWLLMTCGPFNLHSLTLIPAWISNHMPNNVWDEITYPFLNFNRQLFNRQLLKFGNG